MRRVFFHIGAHKTGTTYVQQTAADMEQVLDEAGLRYLQSGRELFGHHALQRAVAAGTESNGLSQQIGRELAATSHDVLVSSENFELLTEDQIKRLVALFADCEPRVLYLFRNWGPLLHANWQEEVKHGATRSYWDYALTHIVNPDESPILNFRIPIERWTSAMGRDRVSIASYDAVCATENVAAFVFRWAGVDNPIEISKSRTNPSYDPFTTETIRALNEMAVSCGYDREPRIHLAYFEKALTGASFTHGEVLRARMNEHVKQTPSINTLPAAQQYFDAFLRDYDAMLIDAPDARAQMVCAPGDTFMVMDPIYLWSPEARTALMEYWLRLVPALRPSIAS